MIFEASCSGARFITMVVRASDEEEARSLAHTAAAVYTGEENVGQIDLTYFDPDGEPGVLVEDPS